MEQETIPALVVEQYDQYKSKQLRVSNLSRRDYDAMINLFKKYGLYQPKKITETTLQSGLSKEEYRKRQRAYMKIWRANHPKYNLPYMQRYKAKIA